VISSLLASGSRPGRDVVDLVGRRVLRARERWVSNTLLVSK